MKFISNFIAEYLNKKGQRFLSNGQIQKAYKVFQKTLFYKQSPELLFNLGLSLASLNRNAEAETYYRKVLALREDNEMALLALSDSLTMQRKWKEANDNLAKLISVSKKNKIYKKYINRNNNLALREKYVEVKKLFYESQILSQKKKYESAKELLIKAAEIDPKDANVQNNIGSLIITITKEPKLALPYFQKAVQLAPDNQQFLKNLSFIQRKIK